MQYFTFGFSDVLKNCFPGLFIQDLAQSHPSVPSGGLLVTLTLLRGPPIYSLMEQTWLFFGCAGGPGAVAAPLPPCQAAPVQAGRTLAARVGESWEYKGVRAEKEEPSQGRSPQEAAEGPRLRLADESSSRYAGRLVPGSLQAAAAAARLEAWPYRRAKQLLCKQTS